MTEQGTEGSHREQAWPGSRTHSLAVSQPVQMPSGTVTLLFTDVEGSTRLWEAEPEAMARALRRHDEIVGAAIRGAGGFIFKTVGDAFCAAFATPQAALSAVVAAQRQLGTENWPTSRPIRVRMGVHTGVCEERDNDYFGPVVNRTARLEAVAHGGQVVVSGTTAELMSETLADGLRLRDLGPHRLRDLGRPEQVFQVEADFLPASFPPLASLDSPEFPNNLPSFQSAFVGRRRELDEIRTLIASSRLVTLVGTGGCGKTRLALHAAAEQLDGARDGTWFVELASVTDSEQIPAAVAAVLGMCGQGGYRFSDSLVEALREQETFILLDNCEHVIDAAAKFCAQIVRDCPKARILATSREPLGVDGERLYRVASLSLPPPDAETAGDLTTYDAVRLFAERAQAQDPGFALDENLGPLVASICRRLDGIPLALELAASRLSSMSLKHLSERLDQRFRLLTGGSRNVMPRQQTLQATVHWSFDLLTPEERQTLRWLSVFVGGFELEAAERICVTEQVDAFQVLDLLGSLVDKSLVVADRASGSVRYSMLETIRQYSAQELLLSEGEAEVARTRGKHADLYLQLAEKAATALTGSRQSEWLRRLDLEWENLRAAFAYLDAEQRTTDVLRLGVALERFAISRGHVEVLNRLRRAVGQDGAVPSHTLTAALCICSSLLQLLRPKDPSERCAARHYAEQGLEMARTLGDLRLTTRGLNRVAEIALFEDDPEIARRLCEEGIAIARRIGDTHMLGDLLDTLAVATSSDVERRRICLEALACFRQSGDNLLVSAALQHLYRLDVYAGLLGAARAHLEEAIALAEVLGAEMFLYYMRTDLTILLLCEDRHEEAAAIVRGCLPVARRVGSGVESSKIIFGAACCAAWQGEPLKAARLHGAADAGISAALAAGSIGWSRHEQKLREDEQGQLRRQLGDEVFSAAHYSGSEMSCRQAVELALDRVIPG